EPGAWKPNATKYGQFAEALARRYSGHFQGLPRVSEFEAWTEPNLTQFLAPQWKQKKKYAPVLYRKMLSQFYGGVHAAQPGATVGRVRKIVHAAEHAKTVKPHGRKALWVTEEGMLSDPPNPKGPPVQKQARWLEESLYLLWKQGASVVVNLNIRDPAYDPHH